MITKEYDFNLKRKLIKVELILSTENEKKKKQGIATKFILQQLHQGGVVLALFKGRERLSDQAHTLMLATRKTPTCLYFQDLNMEKNY